MILCPTQYAVSAKPCQAVHFVGLHLAGYPFEVSRVDRLNPKAAEKRLHCLLLTFGFRLAVLTANQGRKHRTELL